ncbi:MAG: TatD family hydrolase [Planctomycetia bacterium]|nr:TatD family hydrolase [Planctomycetia bacterium]
MFELFDTHAHLDQTEFDVDRAEVLARARQAGVAGILAVGITADSGEATANLANPAEGIYAAVGLQPNYCAQAQVGDWERILALVGRPGVVALGETGLDRHWDYTPFDVQQDYFDRHLRLSQETGLPVVIHSRDCDADILAMLGEARSRGPLRGIMHSFTSTAETAAACLELGLYVSFAGMVTYKKSDALRAVAAKVPSDRILIETDSPYLSPHPLRGKRNEPANVVHTARCLAEVCGTSLEDFAIQTTANARRLLGLSV